MTQKEQQKDWLSSIKLVSIICLLLMSSALVSGCAGPADAPETQPDAIEDVGETAPDVGENNTPIQPPPPPPAPPIGDGNNPDGEQTGLPPEMVTISVFDDIATTNAVPVEDLTIESAQPQSWPDGCLGLGGPDEICTFAIVDGWEVTVTDGENQWIYRTDSEGLLVKLAESSVPD